MAETDNDRTFRCLKIRAIDPSIPEDTLHDLIYENMEPFHQFTVKIVHKPEVGRAAYLNFKYIEDAEAALEQHSAIELNGKRCQVVPIFQKAAAERDVPTSSGSRQKSRDRDYERKNEDHYDSSRRHERSRMPPEDGRSVARPNYSQHLSRSSKYSIDRKPGQNQSRDIIRDSFSSFSEISSKKDGAEKRPSRSLYIGSLDAAITESDLHDKFSRHGIVQCVELKKAQGGGATGNYAFVRFFNLYMAQNAKSRMTGRYIGQSIPRIGYGNALPTRCVWVGCNGLWNSVERLRSAFGVYGEVVRVVWPDSRDYAYVEFSNVNDAREAYAALNGIQFGRERIMLDFVDVGLIDSNLNHDRRTCNRGSPLVVQRQRHSRSPLDRSRTSKSPLDRYKARRGDKLSDSRERRPYGIRRPDRRRSSERRRTPSADIRSVSPRFRSDRSPASDYRSPVSNSPLRHLARSTRSRSPRSDLGSERAAVRSDRSPVESSFKNRNVAQPRDGRTVVLKQPPASELAPGATNFGAAPFVSPVQSHYMPVPPYGASVYPPVVANPSYPPPPLPRANFFMPQATASAVFSTSHVPPPGPSVGIAPATHPTGQHQFYHEQRLSEQPLFSELPPSANINQSVGEAGLNAAKSRQSDSVVVNFPKVWSGALVLKNGAFVVNLHLVSGSVFLVNSLLGTSSPNSGTDCPVLKIAQRLRLDQPEKIDELDRRLRQAGRAACSVMLATPAQAEVDDASNVIQQRPLQSLVTYLCQKEVAAVVPLPSGGTSNTKASGVLHAFPPCLFARKFLQREAPGLEGEYPAEDQLLVIVCESTAEQAESRG
jgi:RNA recognition motif-containing protein